MAKKTYKNGDTVKLTKKERSALTEVLDESFVAHQAFDTASRMVARARKGIFDRFEEVRPDLDEYHVRLHQKGPDDFDFKILYRKEAVDND